MKLFHQFEFEPSALQIFLAIVKIIFLYLGTTLFIQFRYNIIKDMYAQVKMNYHQ